MVTKLASNLVLVKMIVPQSPGWLVFVFCCSDCKSEVWFAAEIDGTENSCLCRYTLESLAYSTPSVLMHKHYRLSSLTPPKCEELSIDKP